MGVDYICSDLNYEKEVCCYKYLKPNKFISVIQKCHHFALDYQGVVKRWLKYTIFLIVYNLFS